MKTATPMEIVFDEGSFQASRAFAMGFHRGRLKNINHATRRQFRKAEKAKCIDEFAAGFFFRKISKIIKE